jgi:osmotically-inducible protein OsmY
MLSETLVRSDTCLITVKDATMLKTIAIFALAAPLGLFAASEKNDAERTAKDNLKLAKKIEEAVSKDKTLNPSSRKIEVTIQNGVVKLSGVVQSEAESQAIQAKAESEVVRKTPDTQVAESRVKIDNELAVSPQR